MSSFYLQIAHMTKGEIYLFDSSLTGPVILLLNQYFSYLIPELFVLYICLVSTTNIITVKPRPSIPGIFSKTSYNT